MKIFFYICLHDSLRFSASFLKVLAQFSAVPNQMQLLKLEEKKFHVGISLTCELSLSMAIHSRNILR